MLRTFSKNSVFRGPRVQWRSRRQEVGVERGVQKRRAVGAIRFFPSLELGNIFHDYYDDDG